MWHCPAKLMGNVALLCVMHRAVPHCSESTDAARTGDGGVLAGQRGPMPYTTPDPTELTSLLRRQDALVTRRQALSWLRELEMTSRLGRRWQVVLPGLYAP